MPLTALSAVVWTIVTTDYKALPVGTDLWHLDLQGKNFEAAQNPCKNDYKGWDLWKNQVAFRASPFTASLEKNLICIQFMSFRTWHLYKCAEWIWQFWFFCSGLASLLFHCFSSGFDQFSIVFAGFPTCFLHFSISSAFHQFFAGPSWFFSPFHRFFYTCHCFSSVVHRFFGRARWFSLFCVILDLVSLLLLVILFSFLLYLCHTGVVFSIARFWNWCCSCLWLFCSSFESVVCYCCSCCCCCCCCCRRRRRRCCCCCGCGCGCGGGGGGGGGGCCCCCWLSSEGEGRIKKKNRWGARGEGAAPPPAMRSMRLAPGCCFSWLVESIFDGVICYMWPI